MDGERFQYGSRSGLVAAGVLAVLLAGLTIVTATATVAGAAISGVGAVLAAAVALRARTTGLWIDGDGVTVVELVGRTRLSLDQVAALESRRMQPVVSGSGNCATVVTHDDTEVYVRGFLLPRSPTLSRERSHARLRQAQEALADAQAAHESR